MHRARIAPRIKSHRTSRRVMWNSTLMMVKITQGLPAVGLDAQSLRVWTHSDRGRLIIASGVRGVKKEQSTLPQVWAPPHDPFPEPAGGFWAVSLPSQPPAGLSTTT